MNRLKEVRCDYTGGGIWLYSALYNDEVWLYGDLDGYFGSYDLPGNVIEEECNCDYDAHWKVPSVPYPTWREILESIRKSCPEDTYVQAKRTLEYFNPDMNAYCMEAR